MAKALSGIDSSVHNIINSNALLLYKVGPVLVCSPTLPVESIIIPPNLSSLPGANEAEPGMFKSMHGMVRVVDLRVRFGVDAADRKSPGRIVISEATGGYVGFWVDEIEDVISFPEKGWSQLPAHVPREVFSRTLIRDEGIRLYADLENLDKFKTTGYLRAHIENIKSMEARIKKQENYDSAKNASVKAGVGNSRTDKVFNEKSACTKNVKSNNKSIDEVISNSGAEKDITKTTETNKKIISKDSLGEKKELNKALAKEVPLQSSNGIKSEATLRDPVARPVKPVNHQVNIKLDRKENKKPEIILTQKSEYLSPSERKEKTATERTSNDVLWFSLLALSLLAVSVYVIEFSGVFSDISSESENNSRDKKVLVKSYSSSVLNNNDDYTNDTNVLPDYSDGSVDISETDEGIVIVINDFEEEISSGYSEIESLDGSEAEEGKESYTEDFVEQLERVDVVEDDFSSADRVEENTNIDTVVVEMSKDTAAVHMREDNPNGKEASNSLQELESFQPLQSKEITTGKVIKTLRSVHVVIAGDTLWDIAKRYVNDPWKYPELARLSKIEDPDLIYPGQKVIIIYNTNK